MAARKNSPFERRARCSRPAAAAALATTDGVRLGAATRPSRFETARLRRVSRTRDCVVASRGDDTRATTHLSSTSRRRARFGRREPEPEGNLNEARDDETRFRTSSERSRGARLALLDHVAALVARRTRSERPLPRRPSARRRPAAASLPRRPRRGRRRPPPRDPARSAPRAPPRRTPRTRAWPSSPASAARASGWRGTARATFAASGGTARRRRRPAERRVAAARDAEERRATRGRVSADASDASEASARLASVALIETNLRATRERGGVSPAPRGAFVSDVDARTSRSSQSWSSRRRRPADVSAVAARSGVGGASRTRSSGTGAVARL